MAIGNKEFNSILFTYYISSILNTIDKVGLGNKGYQVSYVVWMKGFWQNVWYACFPHCNSVYSLNIFSYTYLVSIGIVVSMFYYCIKISVIHYCYLDITNEEILYSNLQWSIFILFFSINKIYLLKYFSILYNNVYNDYQIIYLKCIIMCRILNAISIITYF